MINSLSFNVDKSKFIAGTDLGYNVYSLDPLKLMFSNRSEAILMAYIGWNSKYILYVLKSRPRILRIRDHEIKRDIGEIESRENVLNVLIRFNQLILVTEKKISLYQQIDLKFLYALDTYSNPHGACDIDQGGNDILVCPGLKMGHIYIERKTEQSKITSYIPAHENSVSKVAISPNSSTFASCSERGTIIRVYDVKTAQLLHELRRGNSAVKIMSLNYSDDEMALMAGSENGTLHCWFLNSLVGGSRQRANLKIPISELSKSSGIFRLYLTETFINSLHAIFPNGIVYNWEIGITKCTFTPKPTYTIS